ncbi:MAG: hypothetical protein QOC58_357, partial [Mycobacterium sp.]|nr:hypothetical protein [Mycobacterium sp.]
GPQAQPEPQPQPQMQGWQPAPATGLWLPPGAPGSHWARPEPVSAPDAASLAGRRARHVEPNELVDGAAPEPTPSGPSAGTGRRARSRHSAEYREYGVRNFTAEESTLEPPPSPPPPVTAPAAAAAPPPPEPTDPISTPDEPPSSPQMAAPPTPRHRGGDPVSDGSDDGAQSGGQSVADLLARLQVQPSGGGRRRRRDS